MFATAVFTVVFMGALQGAMRVVGFPMPATLTRN